MRARGSNNSSLNYNISGKKIKYTIKERDYDGIMANPSAILTSDEYTVNSK